MSPLKKCRKCGIEKPVTDFYVCLGRRRNSCKACDRIKNKEYRDRPENKAKAKIYYAEDYRKRPGYKERRQSYNKTWRLRPDRLKREAELRRRNASNWPENSYDLAFETQCGRCAICNNAYPILCADHDRITGHPRALLCRKCNSALGMARDNPYLLRAMADYLDFHRPEAMVAGLLSEAA